MSWGEPLWWWGLLAVLALAAIAWVAGWRHRRRLRAFFSGDLLERVLPAGVRYRRLARDLLALAGLACVVVALAEPLYGKDVQQIEKTGVDIVIAMDLSRSMDAEDVDPSRLERARREVLDLIETLESDRVGLVIYAGGAWPRMPLTQDYDALRMMVEELDTNVFQAQGSEVSEALKVAMDLLDGDASRRAGRAILLLSDGEAHDPGAALKQAREAAEQGIRVYTMGVGVEQAPIPLRVGGVLTRDGETVLTEPDPSLLKDLARASGGAYVQSVASARDIQRLYGDEIRRTLEATSYGSTEQEVWQSGFQWPLGLGLFLWLVSAWLGDGRRRWGGIAAVLLAALLLPGQARAQGLADADALYRAEQYAEAERMLTELTLERPTDPGLYERLGAARYRLGDFEGAARAYDTAARLQGEGGTDAAYNAGNAHYRAGRLEEARERYDRVINSDREHPGATRNLALLQEELQRRLESKPPPQQQEQQGESDEQQQGEGEQQQGEGEQQQGEGEQQQGEQQEGQQGEGEQQGEEQEGQQGDAEGEPSQQGEAQEGEAAGESSDESTDPVADAEGSREQAPDDGQELQGEGGSETAELDEIDEQGDQRGTPGEPFDGNWQNDGPVTPAQAERLLEGVEEGRPRIRVPGRDRGKPW